MITRRFLLPAFAAILLTPSLFGVLAAQTVPGSVKLTTLFAPEGAIRSRPVQLSVIIESNSPVRGATLTITVPRGLAISTANTSVAVPGFDTHVARDGRSVAQRLPDFDRRLVRSFQLTMVGSEIAAGAYRTLIEITGTDSARATALLAQDAPLVTLAPTIPLGSYLRLGLLGIALGYLVRLVMKARDSIPADQQPNPAPPQDGAALPKLGPIGAWMARSSWHFYLVDGVISLVLGAGALLALLAGGQVPDAAARWYGAMLLGFGLGLLTNSELITKLPTRA